MLRTIIFYPCVVMTLVLSFIPSFRYRFVDSKPSNKKFNLSVYRISSAWARLMMRLSGARITVTGEEYLKKVKLIYLFLIIKVILIFHYYLVLFAAQKDS